MREKGNWLIDTKIAHRGYHNIEYPENSMGAFKRAVDNGFGIELDIRILRDNQIVVFHDRNLRRLTGVNRSIARCTYDEIKSLKLLGTNEKIPLLKDVLEMVDGKVPLLIEIKNEGRVGRLEKKLGKVLSRYKKDFAVQSFNPFSVKYFTDNYPNFLRGLIIGSYRREGVAAYKTAISRSYYVDLKIKPDFNNYDIRHLPKRTIKKKKEDGVIILGWTARSKESYHRALEICDNVVFEGFNPNL